MTDNPIPRIIHPLCTALGLACLLLGSACVPAVVGVGGTAGVIAKDQRTSGIFIEDQNIELKAARAFEQDPELNDLARINVISYNTSVLMMGEAPNPELRARAEALVRAITNVKQVFNRLAVAEPSSLSRRSKDTWTTSQVKTRMVATRDFDGTRIKVATNKDVVYLMGLVTRAEGTVAAEIARATSGVTKVEKLFEYID